MCGSAGQGGPLSGAQLFDPVAVATDAAGDLFVADAGDQSVLLAPAVSGTYYGTAVGAGDIGVVVGGTGSYGPYVADGLSATGIGAELNDPRGLALTPNGTLVVTDGFMHVIRFVPAQSGTEFGRAVSSGDLYTLAGARPVSTSVAAGDGTRWVLTHLDVPAGIAGRRDGGRPLQRRGHRRDTEYRVSWLGPAFGRRTFLASGVGLSAGAIAAGAPVRTGRGRDVRRAAPDRCRRGWSERDLGHAPRRLAHGQRARRPRGRRPRRRFVRLDVDGHRPRGGPDRLPARGPAHRSRPPRAHLGQRPGGRCPARLRRLPRADLGRRRLLPMDGPASRTGREMGPRLRPGTVHHVAPQRGLDGAVAAARGGLVTARPRHLPQDRDGAAGGRDRTGHGLRLGRAHVPALRRRRAGRRLAKLLVPRRAVLAVRRRDEPISGGRPTVLGVLHRWYGAGKGRPQSAPGLIVQLSLWYRDGRHVVVGTDARWREVQAEWLPSPQRNNDACDYVEWIDARRHPAGWSAAGYDDTAW